VRVGRQDVLWQDDAAVRWFLDSVRGAIPFAAEQLKIMLQMVAHGREPVARFLDVGAGDGTLTAAMLARYPDAVPVLVDFSAPMLAAARERFAPTVTRPVAIEADLATSGWVEAVAAHAPFDAIVSGLAIHHLEDERKRALYRELFALLAPGGAFAHIEHVAAEAEWIVGGFEERIVDAFWEHGRRSSAAMTREDAAAVYFNRPDREADRLAPLADQLDWLREAGFTNVGVPFRWYELAVFGGYRPR
jgi:cyclopropane fatty-acyl-phospholipid synthase-like methyltransferase